MTRDELRALVQAEISKAHFARTGQAPVLADDLRPLEDLVGFTSPLAEDITAVILIRLQLSPKAIKCPFTRKVRGRYPTVGQILESFHAALPRQVPVNA